VALIWRDAMATALLAVLVANSVHAYNHAVDLHLGGRPSDPWLLGAVSVLLAAALWVRARQLGFVLGRVRPATTPALVPFVEQKTVVLTTRRRDGSPVPTAVSLAVAGKHPLLHGVVVPLLHRLGRAKLGRTVYFELTPIPRATPG
jgi:hypothetical protein